MLEAARVLEREGDVGDRRPVGHGVLAMALTACNLRRYGPEAVAQLGV
jgi:hypothetical protein